MHEQGMPDTRPAPRPSQERSRACQPIKHTTLVRNTSLSSHAHPNGRLALTKFANAEIPVTKLEIITISVTVEESSVMYLLNQLKTKLGRRFASVA